MCMYTVEMQAALCRYLLCALCEESSAGNVIRNLLNADMAMEFIRMRNIRRVVGKKF